MSDFVEIKKKKVNQNNVPLLPLSNASSIC